MVSKNEIPTPDNNRFQKLFSLASLFEGEFSMDWLHDLTGAKPSKILQDLESGVNKGWLIRKSPGLYSFLKKDRKAYKERWQEIYYFSNESNLKGKIYSELQDENHTAEKNWA